MIENGCGRAELTVGGAIPGLLILKENRIRKPASSVPRGFCFRPCFHVPDLTSLMMNCEADVLNQIDPFLSRLLTVIMFYHRNRRNPKTGLDGKMLSNKNYIS